MSFSLTWVVHHRACAFPSPLEQIKTEDIRDLDQILFKFQISPSLFLFCKLTDFHFNQKVLSWYIVFWAIFTMKEIQCLLRWVIGSSTMFFYTMPWMIESLHADILYHGLCLQTQYCLVFMAVCSCRSTMDGHLYHLHIHMHGGHYSSLFTFPHWTFYVGVWKTAPRKCAGNVHYHFNGQMYSLKLFIVPVRAD